MCKSRDIAAFARQGLEAEGARVLRLEHTGRGHKAWRFEVDGREGLFRFSSSPGSSKAIVAARCKARRCVRQVAQGLGDHVR